MEGCSWATGWSWTNKVVLTLGAQFLEEGGCRKRQTAKRLSYEGEDHRGGRAGNTEVSMYLLKGKKKKEPCDDGGGKGIECLDH